MAHLERTRGGWNNAVSMTADGVVVQGSFGPAASQKMFPHSPAHQGGGSAARAGPPPASMPSRSSSSSPGLLDLASAPLTRSHDELLEKKRQLELKLQQLTGVASTPPKQRGSFAAMI